MLIILYFVKLTRSVGPVDYTQDWTLLLWSLNDLNMSCYLITVRIALISVNLTRNTERRASTVSVLCKVFEASTRTCALLAPRWGVVSLHLWAWSKKFRARWTPLFQLLNPPLVWRWCCIRSYHVCIAVVKVTLRQSLTITMKWWHLCQNQVPSITAYRLTLHIPHNVILLIFPAV